ncbi:MAG: hypothetical protein AKCLJLPJ_01069 [Fimbriimonadales bacterium]|nr:hypothetical protein [Fimbriimonadales bacterium]
MIYNEPKTLAERESIASHCARALNLSIPILIDGMDDGIEKRYSGWPDRIFIVDKAGKISYKGEPGPAGFKPREAEAALNRLLLESEATDRSPFAPKT